MIRGFIFGGRCLNWHVSTEACDRAKRNMMQSAACTVTCGGHNAARVMICGAACGLWLALEDVDVFEALEGGGKSFFFLGKVEADVVVNLFLEERRAWYGTYAYLPGKILAELYVAVVAKAANVDQYIVGSLWAVVLKADFIKA